MILFTDDVHMHVNIAPISIRYSLLRLCGLACVIKCMQPVQFSAISILDLSNEDSARYLPRNHSRHFD